MGPTRRPWFLSGIAAMGALYIVYANVTDHLRVPSLEPAKDAVGEWMGLTQTWNMFQRPVPTGGWITIPATTAGGETVDLLTGDHYRSERPLRIIDTFPNYRWRILLVNRLRREGYHGYIPPFLEYLATRWNDEMPVNRRVVEVRFVHHPFWLLPDHRRVILEPETLAVWKARP